MLNLLAYVIIPIYTILFVGNTNWFTMNLSVISGFANRQNAFLLWGILVITFFYLALKNVIRLLPRENKANLFMHIACILLTLGVTTPYLPQKLPFQATLHIVFAFSASVLLLLCLYMIVLCLFQTNRPYYKPYLIGIIAITAFSALLLCIAGIVSSALEIFFTVASCIFVRRLHRRILLDDALSIESSDQ